MCSVKANKSSKRNRCLKIQKVKRHNINNRIKKKPPIHEINNFINKCI